jgi:hypothetical protein
VALGVCLQAFKEAKAAVERKAAADKREAQHRARALLRTMSAPEAPTADLKEVTPITAPLGA